MKKQKMKAFSEEMATVVGYLNKAKANGGMDKGDNYTPQEMALLMPSKTGDSGVTYTPDTFHGVEVELVTPDNLTDDNIIFYIHGGAFAYGDTQMSRPFAAAMAKQAGMRVYSITYRLAPQNPYPAAVDDCFEAYQAMLEKHSGRKIAFVGESAGANLSMVTVLKAKEAGLPLPSSITLYSIPGDLTGLPSRVRNADFDNMISGEFDKEMALGYFPGEDAGNPYISPNLGNLTGFPPLKVVADCKEVLFDDSDTLVEKAVKAGVEVDYQIWNGTFHAFVSFPTSAKDTPESVQVVKETAEFMKLHF